MAGLDRGGAAYNTERLAAPILYVYLVYCGCHFVRYFFAGSDLGIYDPLARFEDDAFYYFEVARNFLASGKLTFDGITPTNGFHPLWFMFVVGIASVFPVGSIEFHVAIVGLGAALVTGGAIALFQLVMRSSLLGRLPVPTRRIAAVPAAVFYQACGLEIGARGMEVSLTLLVAPLALWAALEAGERLSRGEVPGARGGLWIGLLGAILALSRLDAALIMVGWAAGLLWLSWQGGVLRETHRLRQLGPFLAGAVAGGVPFAAYLAMNYAHMGSVVPVSGLAKRLLIGPGPIFSQTAFSSIFELGGGPLEKALKIGWTILAFGVSPMAAVLSARQWREPGWVMLTATAWGTFAYYGLLVLTSDWNLWAWYFWAAVFSAALGLASALGLWLAVRPADSWRVSLLICAVMLGLAGVQSMRPFGGRTSVMKNVTDAISLRAFAESHPGTYAMGDRAGAAAYLVDFPIVQLEGLMGDHRTIGAIRRQLPLSQYLASIGADYYVTAWATPDGHGCNSFAEPAKPGPAAPRMRGRTCRPPAAILSGGGAVWRRSDLEGE